MPILFRPLPPRSEWERVYVLWPRRFGNYLVVCEWVERRVTHQGNSYTVQWRSVSGVDLDIECKTYGVW